MTPLTSSQITAVIVTRGDVDLTPILKTFYSPCEHRPSFGEDFPVKERFSDIIIYDNSKLLDFRVFSRFIAAQMAGTDYVYVQDDDCIVDLPSYPWHLAEPDKILCNMPPAYRPNYPGPTQLLGFGSVFHRDLIRPTFERYFEAQKESHRQSGEQGSCWLLDDIFLVECDRVFTGLNTCKLVDIPITHLSHATAPNRLYRQSDHNERRLSIERRIAQVR